MKLMAAKHLLSALIAFLFFVAVPAVPAAAAEEYGFALEEYEKKSLVWGGHLEAIGEHSDINGDGALTALHFYREPRATLDGLSGALQLDGSFSRGRTTLNWVLQASGVQDEVAWSDKADIFEGYAAIKANPNFSLDLGKKAWKWGKGYAWNPVGFIDRAKDPDNPEEALEGYAGAGVDLVKTYGGLLRTAALTTVVLPVWRGVNEDFGERDNVNLAAKLYLLYMDTDIDFVWFAGNSRSSRYGVDFSKNLAANFEVHGELAYIPRQKYMALDPAGTLAARKTSDVSYLLGIRYLSANDITTIVEFYHNDDGYAEAETTAFFQLIDSGYQQFLETGSDTQLRRAAAASQSGYGRPQSGRDYLYARIAVPEPFDILYFTPGINIIANLRDQSYSASPEMIYTGFTNWEMRLRFSLLNGDDMSEYGEKQNSSKVELRVRYFF